MRESKRKTAVILLGIIGGLLFFCIPGVLAFDNVYKCKTSAESFVGYNLLTKEVDAKAGKVDRPAMVAISGVNGEKPLFHGDGGTAPLVKLSETGRVIWYAEEAPAGTIIMWTLIEKSKDLPAALIQTKSYELFGAVSFTAFYVCE